MTNTPTESSTIPTPKAPQTQAPTLLTAARALVVKSLDDAEEALKMRARFNAEKKRLTEERFGQTRPLDESKRKIMEHFAKPLDMLDEAIALCDGKVRAFNQEQQRIAREEQRKLDEAAAAERRRLEAKEAETRRKAEEKARADREAAEKAAAAGRAEEAAKLAARAQRTEDRGLEKAEAFQTQAAAVVAPIVKAEAPRVAGVQTRKNWKFRIRDASKIHANYLTPDEVKIGKLVRSIGKEAESIVGDGLDVWSEETFASGRAS